MIQTSRVFNKDVSEAIAASIIASFPPAAKEKLLCDAQVIDVPAGGTVYREYDSPRVALIVNGLIRQFRVFPDGKQSTIWYNRKGDILGIPLLIAGPWSVNAQVVMDSSLLVLITSTFQTLAKTDPAVCWSVAQHICRRIYTAVDELSGNINHSARSRIAHYLVEVAIPDKGNQFPLAKVTHQKIADATGLTRESVSRTLHEFRAAGLIESSQNCVTILDQLGLSQIAWPENNDRHL